jgi:hypothetical protein
MLDFSIIDRNLTSLVPIIIFFFKEEIYVRIIGKMITDQTFGTNKVELLSRIFQITIIKVLKLFFFSSL